MPISSSRYRRLGIRVTSQQAAMLKRAAKVRRVSVTEFILHSACSAAEQTLLDQSLLVVSTEQYWALMDMLDRPPQHNAGVELLFSKNPPWEAR